MEPPLPNNSREQQVPGSSFGLSKPQVLGTSPIINHAPQMPKPNGVNDVDNDGASDTDKAMFIQENFGTDNKGKGIIYHHSDHESKKASASDNITDLDDHCSESSAEDDDWITYDEITDVDEYSALQAHFDLLNIPPGVEATIPWLSHGQNGDKTNIETSSLSEEPQIKPDSVNQLEKSSAQSVFTAALGNSLYLPADLDVSYHPLEAKSPWLFDQSKQNMKPHGSNNISINQSDAMKLHNGGETSDASESVKKQASSHYMPHSNVYGSGYNDMSKYSQSMPYWQEFPKLKTKEPFFAPHMASGVTYFTPYSNVPGYGYNDIWKYSGVRQSMPHWLEYPKMKIKEPSYVPHMASGVTLVRPTFGPVGVGMPWAQAQGSTRKLANLAPDDSKSVTISPAGLDNLLRNYECFKQFDTVEDHSDHHYTHYGNMQQASKNWTKSIQQEWKILEKDLPETIFVRVYESRMDLMRAVIIGADGTPYHDGLFFFDIFFPIGYPLEPPEVHYHSGGLRLNPNLYNSGKVCLSLLNTWGGCGNEMWTPGMSTMLQVLVSIQGLILNTNPYFNEPGYERYNGSDSGEHMSERYNEDVFLLSVKTMVYNIRRPPKHFEDFSKGHFFKRAHDILVACKAYTDGAQVGSLVKGRVQDLNVGENGSKSYARHFQESLNQLLSMLVDTFKKIGVSDCEKFLPTQLSSDSNARKHPV